MTKKEIEKVIKREMKGSKAMTTMYAVVAVEYGDSVDGKGRVLTIERTHEKAQAEMERCAREYAASLFLEPVAIYNDSASVGSTDECGCEYVVQEVCIPAQD